MEIQAGLYEVGLGSCRAGPMYLGAYKFFWTWALFFLIFKY